MLVLLPKLALLLACCISPALGESIGGYIVLNEECKDLSEIGLRTKVSLDYGVQSVYLRNDGSFYFDDVPVNRTYILSVLSPAFEFPQLTITLSDSGEHPFVSHYSPTHLPSKSAATIPSLPYPILISPTKKRDFFEPVVGFNPLQMLGNPMILLMGGGAVLMMFLPKIMANLDPELLDAANEMRGGQKSQSALAGLLSGTSDPFNPGLTQRAPAAGPSANKDEPLSMGTAGVASPSTGKAKHSVGGTGQKKGKKGGR